jgi:hypothetical protein
MKNRELTIGLALGDQSSFHCILDESGNVILERNVNTGARRCGSLCREIGYSIELYEHK